MLRPPRWRSRVKARFTDDFNILEVSVTRDQEEAPKPSGDENEFLGWEDDPSKAQREPMLRRVRINVGVLLGMVGISLGVIDWF